VPQVRLIKESRKSPILKPSEFGCLKAAPSINITRGCLHSCVYCYARGFTDAPPSGEVHLYENLPETLEEELARKRKWPSWVSFSTASDPFQGVDEVLEISYRTMRLFLERGIGISFLTKGFIPSEFIELFKAYPHSVRARIGLVSFEARYQDLFESLSAPPPRRLSNIKALADAGIETSVRIDPLIPSITDSAQSLEKLMQGLRAANIRDVSVSYLVMRPSIINRFLSDLPPKLANAILRHYDGQPWQRVITSARTRLLPRAMRMVRYQRIKTMARQYGLQCLLCGCKNPDLPWESCHAWIREEELRSAARQLTLFA